MSDQNHVHLNYGGTTIDIYFHDESIIVNGYYDYEDWGTGNRLGRIHGSKQECVNVIPNESIKELRKRVLAATARAATCRIWDEDLPLSYFERYKK